MSDRDEFEAREVHADAAKEAPEPEGPAVLHGPWVNPASSGEWSFKVGLSFNWGSPTIFARQNEGVVWQEVDSTVSRTAGRELARLAAENRELLRDREEKAEYNRQMLGELGAERDRLRSREITVGWFEAHCVTPEEAEHDGCTQVLTWAEVERALAPEETESQVIPTPPVMTEARERGACAALVRAAGCSCDPEMIDGSVRGDSGDVEIHNSICPIALAAAIEGRGR